MIEMPTQFSIYVFMDFDSHLASKLHKKSTPNRNKGSRYSADADAGPAGPQVEVAAPAATSEGAPAVPQVLLPEEVSAMGDYLGVNLEAGEHFLLAVAKEAVVSPVAPPWEELEDDKGNPYFFNHRTRASTRRHPLDAKFLKLVHTYRDAPPEGAKVRECGVMSFAGAILCRSKDGRGWFYPALAWAQSIVSGVARENGHK